MPVPRLETIASVGYVFACLRDREPRGGCGYYDQTGHYRAVASLGWLLRNSADVHDLWVSTGRYKSLAMGGGPPFGRVNYADCDAMLAVRLTNGRVYVSTWQDRTILHDWLKRPSFLGRPIYWEHHAYIIGDRDYERMAWEYRKRQARERRHTFELTGVTR